MKLGRQLAGIEDARALAQAIVDTVREPLVVLDKDMRVVTASRKFSLTFRVNRHETQGQLLFSLGAGQWDIPGMQAGDAGTMRAITRQRYTRFLHIAKHGRGLMSAVPAQFDCS